MRMRQLAPIMVGVLFLGLLRTSNAEPLKMPPLTLTEKAQPLYAAVALDGWTTAVAYVVFDGNGETGYKRAHVFIPGHSQFGKPVAWTAADGTNFPPLPYSSSTATTSGEDAVEVEWRISAARAVTVAPPRPARPAGTQEVFDYVTGKNKLVTTPAVPASPGGLSTNLHFGFTLDYARKSGEMAAGGLGSGKMPLDIRLAGALPVSVLTTNALPTRGFTPWNQLEVRAGQTLSYGTRKRVRIQVKGGLYCGGNPCKIRSLPRAHQYVLSVSPYMDPPAVSATQTVEQLLGNGYTVEVNTGWYTWTAQLRCPGLTVSPTGIGLMPLAPKNEGPTEP